ncbi:MAG: GNAT family N-acetyltransferase [Lachnospiraceae bacterium]|nr:GNAT family N-acetyltransferase [Lachnospiraceae bacterium]
MPYIENVIGEDTKTPEVRLVEITMSNFEECLLLSVHENQKGFGAPNSYSLSEAYADKVSQPYAIYANEKMVGFLMYDYASTEHMAYILRLMIDRRYQNKGYGERAMRILLQEIRNIVECRFIQISYHPGNTNAGKLYRSLGYEETEEFADNGEIICRIKL